MKLEYFETKDVSHLIEEYWQLSFSKEMLPFESSVLPIAATNITYIFSGNQKAIVGNKEMPLDGLIISGQFFRSYKFLVNDVGLSFGMSFHPTALYKLLNIDVSRLSNKHLPLKSIHKDLHDALVPIFIDHKNPKNTIEKINSLINGSSLKNDESTELIDTVIEIIREKEGLLNIEDLLNEVSISQKTLETKFKRIVGLTPGKYIRLYRFLKLMRKYESQQIAIKDLIYMYNYYDQSHFTKDFKLFMLESPKSYFIKEHPLIKKYLNK